MAESDVLAAIAALPTDADVQAAVGAALLVYDPPAGTNYVPNPATVGDNAGLATGYTCAPANATVTKSKVTRVINGRAVSAQKIRVVGGAGVAATITLLDNSVYTAAGTFVKDDTLSFSCYLKITEVSGSSFAFNIVGRNVGTSYLEQSTGGAVAAVDAGFVLRSYSFKFTHVDTSLCGYKFVTPANFHEGDVLEFEVCLIQAEKSTAPTSYFDGSYLNCAWTGAANGSTSVRSSAQVIAVLRALLDAVKLKSDTIPASPAAVGSAMTLTTGERTSVATSVWASATRTLSGFGTLAADVWASAARALTDKAGFSGTATNMVADAPLATANASAVRTNLGTELARIDENVSAAKTLTSGERTSIASAVSSLATTGLAALKALLDAVKLKSDTIGTGQAIVQSPVAASGTITVYSGDDYASADSRAITVTVADTGHALGLDGAVVKLKAAQATWEAASVVSTTDGYTVTFEATAAQTAAVTRAQHYELEATLANGHVVTLAKGSLVTRTNIPAVGTP